MKLQLLCYPSISSPPLIRGGGGVLLTTIAVLTTSGFVPPASAQNVQNVKQTAQASADQVLQACSQDKADTLPIPFSDVSPRDWAFKAVMSMYYCGAYRGSVPPEQVKPFLQPQSPLPSRSSSAVEQVKPL